MHTRARARSQTRDLVPPTTARPTPAPTAPEFGADWAADMQDTLGNEAVLGSIQRMATGSPPDGDPAGTFGKATSGGGSTVPFRTEMESAFGEDFSGVQAHLGQAGAMADLGARAAARGEDVAFASSNPDREVVAHELAHVVQQRGGGTPVQASSTVSTAQDASEREADAVAGVVAGGGWVAPGALQALPGAGIQRAPPTPGEGPAPSTTPSSGAMLTPSTYNLDPGTESDLKAAEAFVAAGVKEKKGFVPSTNSGGFDAKYDPGSGDGTLTITVQGAVHFIDPITGTTKGSIAATNADYDGIATALNALPQAKLNAVLPEFHWSTDSAKRQEWMDKLKSTIEGAWGGQFAFHVHRPGWTWVGSKVALDVKVAARDAGKREAGDHLAIEAVKLPDPGVLENAGTDFSTLAPSAVDPGDAKNAYDQTMTIGSSELTGRADSMLRPLTIPFEEGKSDATAHETKIAKWARKFSGDPSNKASHAMPVLVEGHASSKGKEGDNQALSDKRAKAVVDLLRKYGFEDIDTRVTPVGWGELLADQTKDDPKDRSVTITPVGGEAQVVATHEFGHAFGLDDEYATQDKAGNKVSSGTGGKTGEATGNDPLVKKMKDESGAALPGSIYENNDSIMSGGNEVRAQHYATFHEALRTITAIEDWALGAAGPKPTVAVGDFPTPTTPPDTAVA